MSDGLTWDEAVKAMQAEKFRWSLKLDACNDVMIAGFGWFAPNGEAISVTRVSLHYGSKNPTEAINDLLIKCRERWPAKHSWDDEPFETLYLIALNTDWGVHIDIAQDQTKGRYYAAVSGPDNLHQKGWGDSPKSALLAAMKAAEAVEAR